jgi:hypothetical protein
MVDVRIIGKVAEVDDFLLKLLMTDDIEIVKRRGVAEGIAEGTKRVMLSVAVGSIEPPTLEPENIFDRIAAGKAPKPQTEKKDVKDGLRFQCICGANYCIERPKGNFLFECYNCGRYIVQVNKCDLDLRGVNVPQFVDSEEAD